MAEALRLAWRGQYSAHPNPRVGCVIAHGEEIVGSGWHARTGAAHAEVVALEDAGDAARGATAYVTLEPCCHHGRTPPCTDALLEAGIARVVVGAGDPFPAVDGGGLEQLRAAGIDVLTGVLEQDCAALNAGYNQRVTTGAPKVTSKLAVSVDGRTALGNGVSQWITGTAAREDVQKLRARSGAILTGIGTVLADDPSLNVRGKNLPTDSQPLRVVVDSRLRLPVGARLLSLPGDTLVASVVPDAERESALRAAGASVEQLPAAGGRVDLARLLQHLGQLQINDVLVEAGPVLNGALLAAGLLDELIVYQAPHVLGAHARGMFAMEALTTMHDRPELRLLDWRRVGDDLRVHYSCRSDSD